MKNKSTLLFFLLLMAECLYAADPKFYVVLSPSSKETAGYINSLDSEFFNGLRKKFPCASSLSQSDVNTMLDMERQKQLLGVGDVDQLMNIAEAMKCDYLVNLRVRVLENNTVIEAFIIKTGQNKVISRTVEIAPGGQASIDAIKMVSQKLIDDLYQYNSQLCREKTWQGTLSIEQHTSLKVPNADDPKKPGATFKSDLSFHCVVDNDVAQYTVNFSDQVTGAEGNATTVVSGSGQTDVSISILEGKLSISVGMVPANGTESGNLGGGGFSSDVTIQLGNWSMDAVIGSTDGIITSTSSSVKQGDLTFTWSLTKK
jgi:hypothetical protein